jgi:Fic family protein
MKAKATATRDLQELAEMGVLQAVGAGRSVHYDLKL